MCKKKFLKGNVSNAQRESQTHTHTHTHTYLTFKICPANVELGAAHQLGQRTQAVGGRPDNLLLREGKRKEGFGKSLSAIFFFLCGCFSSSFLVLSFLSFFLQYDCCCLSFSFLFFFPLRSPTPPTRQILHVSNIIPNRGPIKQATSTSTSTSTSPSKSSSFAAPKRAARTVTVRDLSMFEPDRETALFRPITPEVDEKQKQQQQQHQEQQQQQQQRSNSKTKSSSKSKSKSKSKSENEADADQTAAAAAAAAAASSKRSSVKSTSSDRWAKPVYAPPPSPPAQDAKGNRSATRTNANNNMNDNNNDNDNLNNNESLSNNYNSFSNNARPARPRDKAPASPNG